MTRDGFKRIVQLALVGVGLAAGQSLAQRPAAPASVVDSYTAARAVVEAALAAHGGQAAIAAAGSIRVVLDGEQHWRHQSRRVDPPFDRERDRSELLIDLPNGRVISARWQTYPGGIHRHTGFITDGKRGFALDFRRGTHTTREYPPASTQSGQLYTLPQFVLRDLLAGGRTLRSLGRLKLTTGDEVDVVAGVTGTTLLTVGFDPATRYLRAVLNVGQDIFGADSNAETEFLDYRPVNGLAMPGRYVVRSNGVTLRDLRFAVVEPGYVIPAERLSPPSGSVDTTSEAVPDAVRTIAPGVWAIGGGSASLAVAFSDHVVVIDALNNATDVLARLATLAPGKPVRYVVPTHHHDDHAGGVAAYVRAGAAVVTTPGSQTFMTQIGRVAGNPRIEVVSASRIFEDASQRLEVHLLQGNPHAEEMLVAWLPRTGLIFQGDLIDSSSSGAIPSGTNNPTTQHFATWLRGKNWPIKVYGGTHGFLRDPLDFAALAAAPLLPQQIR